MVSINLTEVQKEALFRMIVSEDKKKLDTLYLGTEFPGNGDLSKIPADIIGRAVVKSKKVNFCFTGLTPQQVQTLLAALDKEKNTKLHTLGLVVTDLSTVEPDV